MLAPTPETPSDADRALHAALRIIGLASRLLPDAERRAFLSEWHAEIVTRHGRMRSRGRISPAEKIALMGHAAGAVRDAWYQTTRGFGPRDLLHDLKLSWRSLARRPGFTATAVVTLMLGIGANTALFSIVRGVLLRPFPYHEPDRLVQLVGHRVGEEPGFGSVSYPNLADLERDVASLSGVAGLAGWRPALTEGEPEMLPGATVSWDYFDVLGVLPAAGRFFGEVDEGSGREPAVVISHGLWTRRFGGSPDVVGRTISINNEPYLVRGVAPRGFEGPHLIDFDGRQPDIWRTPWFEAEDWFRSGRSWMGLARLRDGTDREAAAVETEVVMGRLAERWPDENRNRTVTLVTLRESVVGGSRRALYMLLGAVGLVLLVACANVASLLTGRMLERRDELLIRSSLGASGGRLLTHLFAEGVAIAVMGVGLGILLAYFGVGAIVRIAGSWLPRPESISVDGATLVFSALLGGFTVLLFGLLPSWRMLRGARLSSVSGGRRSGSGGREAGAVRRALVLTQIATTVVLVVGAGVLLQSFRNLHHVDLGVARERVLTMEVHGSTMWDLEPEAAAGRYSEMFERIRGLPGVEAVGAMDVVPLADNRSCDGVTPLDRPPPAPGEGRCAEVRSVTPGALAALGTGLLSGRAIEWRDDGSAPGSMVITRRMAEEFWPGRDPIGERALVHSDTFEVVGVAADVRHFGPERAAEPMVFLPALQEPWNGIARGMTLVVRGGPGGSASALGRDIRAVVHGLDDAIALGPVRPMDDLLAGLVGGPRLRTVLLSVFAGLALVLALVGLAGVMAQSVARRRREIGVRIALGAHPSTATGLVLGDGARLTVAGLVVGLAASAILTRFLTSFVFGVRPLEPRIVAAGALVVVVLGLLSCWIPARRASRIDPVETLRSD